MGTTQVRNNAFSRLYIVAVLIAVGLMSALFVGKVSALTDPGLNSRQKPAPANICQRQVQEVNQRTLTDGSKYISLYYSVLGNDNGRRFYDSRYDAIETENGSTVTSTGSNCVAAGLSSLFWNVKQVDLSNPFYAAAFGSGNTLKSVYLGIPAAAGYTWALGDYTGTTIGAADVASPACGFTACRVALGIENQARRTFATVNDAGAAEINGSIIWCSGMKYAYLATTSLCRVDASTVYNEGGDFAGFLNGDNGNARKGLTGPYQMALANNTPINGLLKITAANKKFDLQLLGLNTRDAVPISMYNQCYSSTPGTGSCHPPNFPNPADPFINAKAGVVLTYFATPTTATATPTPTPTPSPTSKPTPTPKPSAFNLTPSSSVTFDDDESPTVATIAAGISGTGRANNVAVSRSYYYVKSGTTTQVPFSPSGASDPATINFTGSTMTLATKTWNGAALNGLSPGDKVCQDVTLNPAMGTSNASGNVLPGATPTTVSACAPIVAKPYFQVLGGDISAGGAVPSVDSNTGFKSVCTPTTAVINKVAQIAGWNQRAGGNYNGAAAAYVVRSLFDVTDFASAHGVAAPIGLTFANVAPARVNVSSGLFGGDFGAAGPLPCDSSIVDDARTNSDATKVTQQREPQVAGNPGAVIPANTVGGGAHTYVAFGHDVYITANITTPSASANTWTQPGDIPSFRLVVLGGNIYISPAVSQLDGLFYAAPDVSKPANTTGIIDTCQTQAGISDTQLYTSCNNKLTINGSLIAKKIKLRRAAGTLHNASSGSAQSAEDINYGPDMWMTQPAGSGSFNSYNAITGLPPVL